ncbi:MAG: hypothetical protein JSV66_12475 [Trueperaceae bacterium]|nr:MAG: hypothetical protein JSV66_12475 [Trueperaceae bacterium]
MATELLKHLYETNTRLRVQVDELQRKLQDREPDRGRHGDWAVELEELRKRVTYLSMELERRDRHTGRVSEQPWWKFW